MKIVITGGNGYIGARLSQYLAEKGNQVIPVCYPAIPDNSDWVGKMFKVLCGDIRDENTISSISELKADAIIHLISLDHKESEKEPGFVNQINVLPTWRLLDKCTKKGLSKFIYFSTIQVYGKLPNSEIDESFPTNPVNTYGLTHLLSENICDYFNRNTSTNVITVRLSNSYGEPVFPDNNCWWLVINDLCRSAFLKKKIILLSDGKSFRDFLHSKDVCEAVDILLHKNKEINVNNIFNISSGITVSILELAFFIRQVYHSRYGTLIPIMTPEGIIDDLIVKSNVSRFRINSNKILNQGFFSDNNMNAGINEIFSYLEKNSDHLS
jgi:nucleoside-diphosphate-sugar epimerase